MAKTMSAGEGNDLHLLPEICREILTRLSVKSILRFRSICKPWSTLISSPNFISDYSIKSLNKNGDRLLLHINPSIDDCKHNVCSFSSHDKSFMESREHNEIPELFLSSSTSIVGSCNGLICLEECQLTRDYVRVVNLVVWNPTIRKIVQLPSPRFTGYSSYFGFGFDSKISDYKVLSYSLAEGASPKRGFQIFDLRKGVWRDISPPIVFGGFSLWNGVGHYPDFYLDGAVHWTAYRILFSFNFSDECFGIIDLPRCAEFEYNQYVRYVNFKSVTFGGLIHVIVFSKWGNIIMSKSCSVWVMREYGVTESWAKIYDIDLESAQVSPSTILNPYRFLLWENDEVLMVRDLPCGEDLVLYNTGSQKSKPVFLISKHTRRGSHFSIPTRTRSMWIYEESLVLM